MLDEAAMRRAADFIEDDENQIVTVEDVVDELSTLPQDHAVDAVLDDIFAADEPQPVPFPGSATASGGLGLNLPRSDGNDGPQDV